MKRRLDLASRSLEWLSKCITNCARSSGCRGAFQKVATGAGRNSYVDEIVSVM